VPKLTTIGNIGNNMEVRLNLKFCAFLIICVIQLAEFKYIDVQEVDFDENWNYKIDTASDPLLVKKEFLHELPSQRTGKSSDIITEDFQDLQNIENYGVNTAYTRLSCGACKLGVALLRNEIEKNETFEVIQDKFISICLTLDLAPINVCGGIFELYGPVVLPTLKMVNLEAEQICALLLGDEKCKNVENPTHEWNIEMTLATKEFNIWKTPVLDVKHLIKSPIDI
jgi:hypothetical protein